MNENNIEQIEMFKKQDIYCEISKCSGKKIKGWVVRDFDNSDWAGAWYANESRALKFIYYLENKKEK